MSLKQPFEPISFFETIVENNDAAIEEYRGIIDDLKEKNILRLDQEETSNITTDYFTNPEEWEYKMGLHVPFCNKYLGDHVREFLKAKDTPEGTFTDIWTQITNGFQMHHPHTHGDVGYSFIWYIDVDEDEHEGTYFYAPYAGTGGNIEDYQIELQKGQLVIFPSWILHYQPPSDSKVDRYIISGNIETSQ